MSPENQAVPSPVLCPPGWPGNATPRWGDSAAHGREASTSGPSLLPGRGRQLRSDSPPGGAFRAEPGASSQMSPPLSLHQICETEYTLVCLSLTLIPRAKGRLLRWWKPSGRWVHLPCPTVFPVGVRQVVLGLGPLTRVAGKHNTGRIQSQPAALKSRLLGQGGERRRTPPFTG